MQSKRLKRLDAIFRKKSGPLPFLKTLATAAGLCLMILILANLSACASARPTIPETAEILEKIPAVNYNAGSDDSPCMVDLDKNGKIEPAEILPDPYNRCDTPETIAQIMRTNAALDAAKRALGVPVN